MISHFITTCLLKESFRLIALEKPSICWVLVPRPMPKRYEFGRTFAQLDNLHFMPVLIRRETDEWRSTPHCSTCTGVIGQARYSFFHMRVLPKHERRKNHQSEIASCTDEALFVGVEGPKTPAPPLQPTWLISQVIYWSWLLGAEKPEILGWQADFF